MEVSAICDMGERVNTNVKDNHVTPINPVRQPSAVGIA
jgi:hypothetical protein